MNISAALARFWLLGQSGSPVVRVGGTVLAFSALALAIMLTQAPAVEGVAPGAPLRPVVAPTTLPDVANWRDESDKTAFSIRLHAVAATGTVSQNIRAVSPLAPVGQFSFTLPTGDQILGVANVTTLDNGDFSASTGGGQANPSVFIQSCQQAQLAGAQPQNVYVTLAARFDAHALVAIARMAYIPVVLNPDGSVANQADIGAFCKSANTTVYTMSSGCNVDGTCDDPVSTASQNVTQYENQLVAASNNPSAGAWEAVYNISATVVRGEYTSDQFASAMDKSLSTTGKITSITPSSAPIQIQVAPTGQAYFISQDTVTFSKDGKTSSRAVSSYYLLNGSTWQFWFSA